MKVNTRLIALMVSLAAGSAAAATPGTTAGTQIKNVASATFTDPSTGAAVTNPVLSNEVITTVTPVTGFDIVYTGGQADGTTASTPATGTPTYDVPNVNATSSTSTTYTVVNNSNINGYVVNLAADTTGTANAPTSVKYYPAGTTSFIPANEITSVTLSDTGINSTKDIIQVITITGATAGQTFSASPKGTAPASTDTTAYPTAPTSGAFAQYVEATNNTTTGDLQYTRVTVATPVVTVEPPVDTNPSTPAVDSPTPGTLPDGSTNPNTYTPPTNTGVTNNPGTLITADPATGNQAAYPKSDTDSANDVVTFVSNVKNGGTVPDVMIVKPTAPSGSTVVVKDALGNTLTPDANGLYTIDYDPSTPGIDPTPAGASAPYQVIVTYPDSDTSATPVVVTVDVFSGNVPSAAPLDTGTLTIYPPDMKFGDTVGAAPTGVPNSTLTPTETVTPGGATNTTPSTTTDASAVFPVSIRNTGAYGEPYTLVGTVDIINKDGSPTTVSVKYYDKATGALLTGGVTPVIPAGTTVDFYAVVDVPSTAAATTTANPEPMLQQTATGNYSGDTATDTNDKIKIGFIGAITVAKTQSVNSGAYGTAPVTGAIGQPLSYKILAKNTYNTPVSNFVLVDKNGLVTPTLSTSNAFTYITFNSASVATTGFGATKTPYYSTDGGSTWSTTAPTAVTAADGIQVYIDTDGVQGTSNAPTAGDIVPADATIELTINNTIK